MSRSDFQFSYLRQVNFHEVGGSGLLHDHQAVQLVNESIREFLRSHGLDMSRQATASSWQTSSFTISINGPVSFDCYLEILVRGEAADDSKVTFAIEAFTQGAEQSSFHSEVVWLYRSRDGSLIPIPAGIQDAFS